MKQATPTRNVKKKWSKMNMSKAFAALRLWDIFPFFSPFWDDNLDSRRVPSPKPKRGNSRTSRSRGGLWGDARVLTTQGWKKHPKKNTRNVDFNTRNDTFTPETKKMVFPPKHFFATNIILHQKHVCIRIRSLFTPDTFHIKQRKPFTPPEVLDTTHLCWCADSRI